MSNNLWWLDDCPCWQQEGPEDELGFSFGDVVGAIGKVAAAPVNAVASVLPKPIQGVAKVALNPVGAVAQLATGAVAGQADKALGLKASGSVGGTARALPAGPVNTQAAANLRALAAAKPAGMSQADYIAALRASKTGVQRGAVSQGAIAAEKAVGLRALAAGKPAGMSQADYIAMLKEAKAKGKTGPSRLVARSTGNTADGQAALIAMVADAVNKKLAPELSTMNHELTLAKNQRLATSEHNAINARAAFRRKVLSDLMRMSSCLPSNHPARRKIRKFGIMSGLV